MQKLISSSQRTRKAQFNVLFMFCIKICNILINLAYVPLLIKSLDSERYGIWLTITTIVSWIAFFDIGLGNGLRNKLAETISLKDFDNAKRYVSTTYIAMAILCILFLILVFLFVPLVNWNIILNTHRISEEELVVLMLCVLSCLFIQLFLKLINSILYALQKPAMASLLLMLSQLFSFIGVLIYSLNVNKTSLLYMGIIISIAPVFVYLLFSYIYFEIFLKDLRPSFRHYDSSKVKTIVFLGTRFFWIQLTSLFLFQSNNLIIAHVCDSYSVAEYNIAYKYIGLIEMFFMIVVTPFWSAATEAYAKKDYTWIRDILKKLKYISYLLLMIGIILILLSDYAYEIWLSSEVVPDKLLMLLLLVFFANQLSWIRYGQIINGMGYIKLQFYITLIEAVIHIPLAFTLGNLLGIKGVVLSLIITTFFNTIWPQIQIKNIFLGKEGIWQK